MEDKGGLVDRIMKSAEDFGRDEAQKVHRKKITLDDLNKVIVEYVQKTAGMGNPELRSRIVQMELQMGAMREQAGASQRTLDAARAGWKSSQDQIAALSRERAGLPSGPGPELAEARKEASLAREEAARLQGRLAAFEAQSADGAGKQAALLKKAESLSARLEEALHAEKKMKGELLAVQAREAALRDAHRREADDLRDQIDALSAGYDHVEFLPTLDPEAILERAKAAGVRAADLSVDAPPAARTALERLEARCAALRLALEALRDEAAAKRKAVDAWEADYPSVLRLAEIHRRFEDAELEIRDLEGIAEAFAPEEEAKGTGKGKGKAKG